MALVPLHQQILSPLRKDQTLDDIGEMAVTVMFILTEEHKNPWKCLRDFVTSLDFSGRDYNLFDDVMTVLVPEINTFFKSMKSCRRQCQTRICWHCQTPLLSVVHLSRCSICQCAHYCSKRCQWLAWSTHKQWCTAPSVAPIKGDKRMT